MKIAGIDIGTTGCKCTVYSSNGTFVTEAYEEYEATISKTAHTLDPELVWKKICMVIAKAAAAEPEIAAIGVTSFGESCVFLDEKGDSLLESILYTDPRGEEECKEIAAQLGEKYIFEHTGLKPGRMYSAPKWRWLSKYNPEVLEKCRHICLFEDYIVYMLSGIFQVDYSIAARTMAFDVYQMQWDEHILKRTGVDVWKLSKPVPTGTPAGKMRREVQKMLGFRNQPVIVSGCHDQMAAAIGTGVLRSKMAVDGTGTVECITSIFHRDSKVNEQILYQSGIAVVPFLDGLFAGYAFSYTGGALLKWYRDQMADLEADRMRAEGKNPYEEFNQHVDENQPSGLLILPYFAGAGTPYMDEQAKGVMTGLTMDTTRHQIYQGLMEGVTYEMKLNLNRLAKAGITVDEIYATGGGASSKKWLQMKANILDCKVISLGAAQSGTLGCIMLAARACGVCKNLDQAAQMFITYKETYLPQQRAVAEYQRLYRQYIEIYPALKEKGVE